MFGFRMKDKTTSDRQKTRDLIIKKVKQAEKLVSEIKILIKRSGVLQKKES